MVSLDAMKDFLKNAGFDDVSVDLDAPRSVFFPYVTYTAVKH
jgi:hypothetical protein